MQVLFGAPRNCLMQYSLKCALKMLCGSALDVIFLVFVSGAQQTFLTEVKQNVLSHQFVCCWGWNDTKGGAKNFWALHSASENREFWICVSGEVKIKTHKHTARCMNHFRGTHLINQDPVTIEGHQVGLHHLQHHKAQQWGWSWVECST